MALRQYGTSERSTVLGLIGIFWSVFGIVALLYKDSPRTRPTTLDFVMLGLATYRLGRVVAFDKVGEPLRAPFTRTVPDESGAGDTVVPAGRGPREVLGELLSCPICAGTWIAAALVYGLQILPGPTRMLITIMSAIGLAEILHAATEAMSWFGDVERRKVGASSVDGE